jgi:AcrR family transcriptional regulator
LRSGGGCQVDVPVEVAGWTPGRSFHQSGLHLDASDPTTWRVPPTSGVDRRTRKRDRTRNEILETARRLFALHGFAATSVARIADAADVAEGTVYNHFPRKEDLFFHGRCPWAQITEHLAANPERYTTGPELIGVVSDIVRDHLVRLAEPGGRTTLEDLTGNPGLALWELGLQQRAEAAISAHVSRHAARPVDAEADRCAALTIAEASTLVADRRRAVLDPAIDTSPVGGLGAAELLHGRLVQLHDLVVDQVDGPLASH